ncbi:MAG: GTPase ObgE [Planctomycetota bacterium]
MFLDRAIIRVKAGDGGPGCVSFRREKFVPRGGPDGGDGGDGGDVIIVGSQQAATLLDFNRRPEYAAGDGKPGSGGNRVGKDGQDLLLRVPPGTTIFDERTGLQLKDITEDGQAVTVARGGGGGKGNARFKSATNQAPRTAEDGEEGGSRELRLELRLIADVGLVGLPNAGKSTLLGTVSAAHPKVSAHPFTTLAPNLGIVDLDDFSRLVLADMPGLIEGAHGGKGLGDEFLRHIERTRVLVYLVDVSPGAESEPAGAYDTLRREIRLYSELLAERPFLVAANKTDVDGAEEGARRLERHVGADVSRVSALTGDGVRELLWQVKRLVDETRESAG